MLGVISGTIVGNILFILKTLFGGKAYQNPIAKHIETHVTLFGVEGGL